ncbi:3-isopropylmalate dehydrogenase [Aspergillus niger]|uniref:3-isopropylmalate dehydrogenase n=1 Tax=Aspergillus niger TaxID=5061 RepID=A0A505HZS0_ASPNG|nr:3-isopropylmalate dehydrogenase [Aspergillus niger]
MVITRVTACHVVPHFLSASKATSKAVSLIHQAARNAAHVVVLPESYVAPFRAHHLFSRMVAHSITLDARPALLCLYNSNLIIDTTGSIAVHHRKLMPTSFEKSTRVPAMGMGFPELTREQIHISSWPCIWLTRMLYNPSQAAGGTGDASAASAHSSVGAASAGLKYNNVPANRLCAAAHYFEAKCFGITCSGFLETAIKTIIVGPSSSHREVSSCSSIPREPQFKGLR